MGLLIINKAEKHWDSYFENSLLLPNTRKIKDALLQRSKTYYNTNTIKS